MSFKDARIQVIEENTRPYINGVHVDYLKLPDRELKVLLALKSFAWNHKDNCYPSIETIGEIIDKKETQVREILRLLEEKGLIRTESQLGYANVYYITNKDLRDTKPKTYPQPENIPPRKSVAPPLGNPDPK